MDPSDDRLLIAEGQALRQRLADRIAESRELCAHAAILCARAKARHDVTARPTTRGAGGLHIRFRPRRIS